MIVTCEWFASCENGTSVAIAHPVLEYVPICPRCLAKVQSMTEGTIEEFDIIPF